MEELWRIAELDRRLLRLQNDLILRLRDDLRIIIQRELGDGSFDVCFFNDMEPSINLPPNSTTIFHIGVSQDGRSIGPLPRPSTGSNTIVVYGPVSLLSAWDLMQEDVDSLLSMYDRAIIVLVHPPYGRLPFEGHSYILSMLLSSLPRSRFTWHLDVYAAPEFTFWCVLRLT